MGHIFHNFNGECTKIFRTSCKKCKVYLYAAISMNFRLKLCNSQKYKIEVRYSTGCPQHFLFLFDICTKTGTVPYLLHSAYNTG
jgi:hypothetical protein